MQSELAPIARGLGEKTGSRVVAISCDQSLNSDARPTPSTVRLSQRGSDLRCSVIAFPPRDGQTLYWGVMQDRADIVELLGGAQSARHLCPATMRVRNRGRAFNATLDDIGGQ
jgi:hypothetical protein